MFWKKTIQEPIGLIAGTGDFPLVLAQAIQSLKKRFIIFSVKGLTNPAIETYGEKLYSIHMEKVGDSLEQMKAIGIRNVVLAGGVPKKDIYNPEVHFDETTQEVIGNSPKNKGDDHLLRAFEILLKAKYGISVLDPRRLLKESLASRGVMTRHQPTANQWEDLRFGKHILKSIGKMDIGQAIVVKDKVVLAVEALEGTDEAIKRGAKLGHGEVVVVKMAKPRQNLKIDLPCTGPQTLKTLKSVSSGVLGVEAGKTLMLFKEKMIQTANEENISIVGL